MASALCQLLIFGLFLVPERNPIFTEARIGRLRRELELPRSLPKDVSIGALEPVAPGAGWGGGDAHGVDCWAGQLGRVTCGLGIPFWARFRVSPGESFLDSFWVALGSHFGSHSGVPWGPDRG